MYQLRQIHHALVTESNRELIFIIMKLLFSSYTKCNLYLYFLDSHTKIMIACDIYQVINNYFKDNLNAYVL